MNPRRSLGFTLIELLVSITIMLILVAIVFQGSRSLIDRGRSAVCVGNLKGLGVALQLYLGEHQQQMPPIVAARPSTDDTNQAIDTVLTPYVQNPKTFACPSDRSLAKTTGTSYYWNSAMSGQNLGTLNFLAFVQDSTRIPLLCDKEGWHVTSQTKVNFLYADGHVTREFNLFTSP